MTRMRFDVEKHEVRTRDQMWELQMTHDEKGFIDGEAWTKVTGQLNVTWSGKVNGQTSKLTTDDLKDPFKAAVTGQAGRTAVWRLPSSDLDLAVSSWV